MMMMMNRGRRPGDLEVRGPVSCVGPFVALAIRRARVVAPHASCRFAGLLGAWCGGGGVPPLSGVG
jgi:hypothetical protein